MTFLFKLGIRILEFLFFAGWIGSLLVILLTGIEDFKTILGGDDSETKPTPPNIQEPSANRR